MIKKIFSLGFFFISININIFSQIVELPLSQKIQQSSDIFEGKVIHKTCFWNTQHTLIFTSNTIEIYKVFKGKITATAIEIITEGGNIGNEMQGAEPSLNLNEGYIGVFMAEPFPVTNPQIQKNKTAAFRIYGGTQGFIKYNLLTKTAADPFKKYNNIQEDVYKIIIKYTGKSFREIKPFDINQANENKTIR